MLSEWVTGLHGLGADAAAVVLAAFGLLLPLAAARGRVWKRMWFIH